MIFSKQTFLLQWAQALWSIPLLHSSVILGPLVVVAVWHVEWMMTSQARCYMTLFHHCRTADASAKAHENCYCNHCRAVKGPMRTILKCLVGHGLESKFVRGGMFWNSQLSKLHTRLHAHVSGYFGWLSLKYLTSAGYHSQVYLRTHSC